MSTEQATHGTSPSSAASPTDASLLPLLKVLAANPMFRLAVRDRSPSDTALAAAFQAAGSMGPKLAPLVKQGSQASRVQRELSCEGSPLGKRGRRGLASNQGSRPTAPTPAVPSAASPKSVLVKPATAPQMPNPFERVTIFGWGRRGQGGNTAPSPRAVSRQSYGERFRHSITSGGGGGGDAGGSPMEDDLEDDSFSSRRGVGSGDRPRLHDMRNRTFGTTSDWSYSKISLTQYQYDDDDEEGSSYDRTTLSSSSPRGRPDSGGSRGTVVRGHDESMVELGESFGLGGSRQGTAEGDGAAGDDASKKGDDHTLTGLTNIELLRLRLEEEERAADGMRHGSSVEEEQTVGAQIAEAQGLQQAATGHSVIDEALTGMPVSDCHNYQLYCQYHNMNVVMRPIADGAASAFIGTFEIQDPTLLDDAGYPILERTEHAPWELLQTMTVRHSNARGKTMATALKSSPYNPIKGSVPVHAQLSKVGAAQAELKMVLEAALIEAEKMKDDVEEGESRGLKQNKQALTHVYARLKDMEGSAVKMFNKIKADSQKAMDSSRYNLQKLMSDYCKELAASRDKFKVSQMYVDTFNNSQFLGECNARYGPLQEVIYFVGWSKLPHVDKTQYGAPYTASGLPMFVLLPKGCTDPAEAAAMSNPVYRRWAEEREGFEDMRGLPEDTELYVVRLVSSRQFSISKATGRIEEAGEGAMLVPDYDGLVYAEDRSFVLPKDMPYTAPLEDIARAIFLEQYREMNERLSVKYVAGQGMVNIYDAPYIEEMRSLTDWKQNHGVEAFNIVKTQHFLPGNYATFRSNGDLLVLSGFEEVTEEYRHAWARGVPFLVNPNWNVLLDDEGLPIIPHESVQPLYDLDERDASLLEAMRSQKTPEWDNTSIKAAYERLYTKEYVEHWTGVPRMRDGKKATELEVWRHYVRYRDEKKVIQMYFNLRALLLYPPYVVHGKHVQRIPQEHRQNAIKVARLVQAAMRHSQNKRVMVIKEELVQQKKVFEAKHGLKTTEFLDKIWDYLMLTEVEGGYCPQVPQPGDENSGFRDYEVIRQAKQIMESANISYETATATQIDTQISKGANQLTGEHHGLSFLSRANEYLPFTGHNPWMYPQKEEIVRTARDAVELVESDMRLKQSQSAGGLSGSRRGSRNSLHIPGLSPRGSIRNLQKQSLGRTSSVWSMGRKESMNPGSSGAPSPPRRASVAGALGGERRASLAGGLSLGGDRRGSVDRTLGGHRASVAATTGISFIDDVIQELEEGTAAVRERRSRLDSVVEFGSESGRTPRGHGSSSLMKSPRSTQGRPKPNAFAPFDDGSRRSSFASIPHGSSTHLNTHRTMSGAPGTPKSPRSPKVRLEGSVGALRPTSASTNFTAGVSSADIAGVDIAQSVNCTPATGELPPMDSPRRIQFVTP